MKKIIGKTKKHLHNFFIPHEGNNHLPHSVRHQSLLTYGALLVAIKVFIVFGLFVVFPNYAEFSTITQRRVTQLVNQVRSTNGLAQVYVNPILEHAAQLKLQDMIGNKYFAHTSPDGIEPWSWFKQAGYLYTYAGENLAMNFVEAENVHDAWMDSPTHRANILNAHYNEIGVAVGMGEINGQVSTLVVQLFGATFVKPTLAEEPPKKTTVMGSSVPLGEPSRLSALQGPAGARELSAPERATEQESQESVSLLPTTTPPGQLSDQAGAQEVTLAAPVYSGFIGFIYDYLVLIPALIVVFVVVALLLKIFIKFRIQHKNVIIHALLIILIGALLIWINFHFLEFINGPVIIK